MPQDSSAAVNSVKRRTLIKVSASCQPSEANSKGKYSPPTRVKVRDLTNATAEFLKS